MQKKIRIRAKELSKELNIPESIILKAFESQFKMVREEIKNTDYSSLTEEEFNNIKTSFNWKYLGKFYTKYYIIQKLNKR